MFVVLLVALLTLAPVLVLVTITQMLYMDSVRVRARELPFLEMFRERIADRMSMKPDDGILTFSLAKHSLLVMLGIGVVGLLAGATLTPVNLAQAAGFGWLGMIFSTYVIPQLLYRRTRGAWFVGFVPLLRLLAVIIRPLAALLRFLQSLAELGEPDKNDEETSSAEESIDALISAGAEEGILEEEDRRLIQSVVAFGDKTVREVMTPRPALVTISADSSLEDLRQLVIHEQYSRIPVFDGDVDNIIGFVHVRDMFELDHTERTSRRVNELTREIRAVPETKRVGDLLREMQQNGTHMAVVVDEYGSTAGLVTMEDLVEEIVGEIRDEHEPGHDVEPDPDGGYIVSGSFDVDHLSELLDYRPPEHTEATTVGGLASEWAGHVPSPGETVEHEGLRIEVLASNELRVDQVRISRIASNSNGNGRRD